MSYGERIINVDYTGVADEFPVITLKRSTTQMSVYLIYQAIN